jgi:hypothetical protein
VWQEGIKYQIIIAGQDGDCISLLRFSSSGAKEKGNFLTPG